MYFRCTTLFFIVTIIVFVMNIEEADANPAVIIATRILARVFAKAGGRCLKDAAVHCRHHYKHAHKVVECGKQYFHQNKGRCVVG